MIAVTEKQISLAEGRGQCCGSRSGSKNLVIYVCVSRSGSQNSFTPSCITVCVSASESYNSVISVFVSRSYSYNSFISVFVSRSGSYNSVMAACAFRSGSQRSFKHICIQIRIIELIYICIRILIWIFVLQGKQFCAKAQSPTMCCIASLPIL